MRIPTRVLLLIILLAGGLFALACNLTNHPPTPTAPPAFITPTNGAAPTLFASITPLPGVGGGGSVATQAPGSTCTPPANWVQYTVVTGDSLGALAAATGVTVQDIVNANCLADPNTLFTGQVLYLPTSPVSG